MCRARLVGRILAAYGTALSPMNCSFMQQKRAKRILIVDDEPLIRIYIRDVLEEAGYVVAEAAGADEAMLLLANDHIRMVISDIEMPGRDGLSLLVDIRRKWPELKLAIMSGRTLPHPDQLPEGTQMLCKPFTEERLRSVVEAGNWPDREYPGRAALPIASGQPEVEKRGEPERNPVRPDARAVALEEPADTPPCQTNGNQQQHLK